MRRIIWQLWLVFSVGVGSFCFNTFFHLLQNDYGSDFGRFLYFQSVAILVGIFPIVVLNLVISNRLLKQNLRLSREISSELKARGARLDCEPEKDARVVLMSESGKDKHELDPGEILFVSSEGNYTGIFVAADETEKVFLRSSLKKIEKQLLAYPYLLRCHRAYIVNVRKVRDVTGNAQGLRLALKNSHTMIPVARRYVKEFRLRLKSVSIY